MKKWNFQKVLAKFGIERVDDNDPFFAGDLPESFDDSFSDLDSEFQENVPFLRDNESAVLQMRPVRREDMIRQQAMALEAELEAEEEVIPQAVSDDVDDLMDDLMGESHAEAVQEEEFYEDESLLDDLMGGDFFEEESVVFEENLQETVEEVVESAEDALLEQVMQMEESEAPQEEVFEETSEEALEEVFEEAAEEVYEEETAEYEQEEYFEESYEEETYEQPYAEQTHVNEAFVRPRNHGVVVALGMFDGVHAGHQHMITMARRDADQLGLPLHVVTFYEHPASVLTGNPVPYLTTFEDRMGLLTRYGMDCLNMYHFTHQFASMDYRDFIMMLVRELDMTHLVVGQDACFGRGGVCTAQTLMQEADQFGISVHIVPHVMANGMKISSTAIRMALANGEVAYANACLTRPYSLSGKIVHGAHRGSLLGFPTANLRPTPGMMVPANGVYVSTITLEDGRAMPAVTNIGVHPTVDALDAALIETHILDFEGDVYGQHVRVELLQMLRGEQKFDTFAQLTAQIDTDVANARAYFAQAQQG